MTEAAAESSGGPPAENDDNTVPEDAFGGAVGAIRDAYEALRPHDYVDIIAVCNAAVAAGEVTVAETSDTIAMFQAAATFKSLFLATAKGASLERLCAANELAARKRIVSLLAKIIEDPSKGGPLDGMDITSVLVALHCECPECTAKRAAAAARPLDAVKPAD